MSTQRIHREKKKKIKNTRNTQTLNVNFAKFVSNRKIIKSYKIPTETPVKGLPGETLSKTSAAYL